MCLTIYFRCSSVLTLSVYVTHYGALPLPLSTHCTSESSPQLCTSSAPIEEVHKALYVPGMTVDAGCNLGCNVDPCEDLEWDK
jgi:hypothetical protein